jgi:hypothetical protein
MKIDCKNNNNSLQELKTKPNLQQESKVKKFESKVVKDKPEKPERLEKPEGPGINFINILRAHFLFKSLFKTKT